MKFKKYFNKDLFSNKWLGIGLLVVIILFESWSLVQGETLSLKQYADKVLAECAESRYRPGCYDKQIPKLMDHISMEDAFKVTAIVQSQDSSYPYCHVLAHELSAREVIKDPSKWKDVVTRCPSGMCSNGCIHGGFQERFRAETFTEEKIETMKPELANLCEAKENWRPTGLEQASCYHALGHLTMYLTEADIKKSVLLCDEFGTKSDGRNFKHVCYDGAFMQIFQPLEPEDFSLIKGKEVTRATLDNFCSQFKGEQFGSCRSESWPLFREDLKKPAGLVKFCSETIPSEVNRCYNAIIYVLSSQFGLNTEKIVDYCSGLPSSRQGQCFANGASRMIEVDYGNIQKAVGLCTEANKYDKTDACFKELLMYSSYNYHVGSSEFFKVCEAFPEPWKTKCLTKK